MAYEAIFAFSKFKKGHVFSDEHGEIILQMFDRKNPHVRKIVEAPAVTPAAPAAVVPPAQAPVATLAPAPKPSAKKK